MLTLTGFGRKIQACATAKCLHLQLIKWRPLQLASHHDAQLMAYTSHGIFLQVAGECELLWQEHFLQLPPCCC